MRGEAVTNLVYSIHNITAVAVPPAPAPAPAPDYHQLQLQDNDTNETFDEFLVRDLQHEYIDDDDLILNDSYIDDLFLNEELGDPDILFQLPNDDEEGDHSEMNLQMENQVVLTVIDLTMCDFDNNSVVEVIELTKTNIVEVIDLTIIDDDADDDDDDADDDDDDADAAAADDDDDDDDDSAFVVSVEEDDDSDSDYFPSDSDDE